MAHFYFFWLKYFAIIIILSCSLMLGFRNNTQYSSRKINSFFSRTKFINHAIALYHEPYFEIICKFKTFLFLSESSGCPCLFLFPISLCSQFIFASFCNFLASSLPCRFVNVLIVVTQDYFSKRVAFSIFSSNFKNYFYWLFVHIIILKFNLYNYFNLFTIHTYILFFIIILLSH